MSIKVNKREAGLNPNVVTDSVTANKYKQNLYKALKIDPKAFKKATFEKKVSLNKLGFILSTQFLSNLVDKIKKKGTDNCGFKVSYVLNDDDELELLAEIVEFSEKNAYKYAEKKVEDNHQYYYSKNSNSPQPLVLSIPPAEP